MQSHRDASPFTLPPSGTFGGCLPCGHDVPLHYASGMISRGQCAIALYPVRELWNREVIFAQLLRLAWVFSLTGLLILMAFFESGRLPIKQP